MAQTVSGRNAVTGRYPLSTISQIPKAGTSPSTPKCGVRRLVTALGFFGCAITVRAANLSPSPTDRMSLSVLPTVKVADAKRGRSSLFDVLTLSPGGRPPGLFRGRPRARRVQTEPPGRPLLPQRRAERAAPADRLAHGFDFGFRLQSVDVGFPPRDSARLAMSRSRSGRVAMECNGAAVVVVPS